jgi:hypothetical protein
MKVIKLDKRYAGFPKWKYAIQFPGHRKYANLKRLEYAKGFRKVFGPDRQKNPDQTVSVFSREWYIWNENWWDDPFHQRIYFNNESDMSAVLLVLDC